MDDTITKYVFLGSILSLMYFVFCSRMQTYDWSAFGWWLPSILVDNIFQLFLTRTFTIDLLVPKLLWFLELPMLREWRPCVLQFHLIQNALRLFYNLRLLGCMKLSCVQVLNLRKEINNDFSILVAILLHLHVVHTAQKDWRCSGTGQDARFPRFWFPPIYSCYGQRNFTVSPRCVFPLWMSLLAPV